MTDSTDLDDRLAGLCDFEWDEEFHRCGEPAGHGGDHVCIADVCTDRHPNEAEDGRDR